MTSRIKKLIAVVLPIACIALSFLSGRIWERRHLPPPCQFLEALPTEGMAANTSATDKPQRPGRHFMQRANWLKDKLDLTPEQMQQIESIFKDKDAELRQLRETVHPKMMQLKTDLDNQVEQILTPEQKAEWRKLKERRQKRLGQGRAGGHHRMFRDFE